MPLAPPTAAVPQLLVLSPYLPAPRPANRCLRSVERHSQLDRPPALPPDSVLCLLAFPPRRPAPTRGKQAHRSSVPPFPPPPTAQRSQAPALYPPAPRLGTPVR